jgi:hypothetical protein
VCLGPARFGTIPLFHGIFVPVIGPNFFRRAQTAVTETKRKKYFMKTKLILIAVLAATLGGAAGVAGAASLGGDG